MFNDLVIKYNKEDKGKNIKTSTANDILNVQSKTRSIIKATIPELQIKDVKAHSIAKKETVFDPYKTKDTQKIKEQDPFKFLFGFSVEPDDRPLPNAYRYKSILNDNPVNVALDRAEITRDLQDGILEEQTKTGNTLSGSEDFMRYYTELRASEFAVPKKEKEEFDAEPNYKYSSKRNFIDANEESRKKANKTRKELYELQAENSALIKRTIEVNKAINTTTIPIQEKNERRKLNLIKDRINYLQPQIDQAIEDLGENSGRYTLKNYESHRKHIDSTIGREQNEAADVIKKNLKTFKENESAIKAKKVLKAYNDDATSPNNYTEAQYKHINDALKTDDVDNLDALEYSLMYINAGINAKFPGYIKKDLIRIYKEISNTLNKQPRKSVLEGSSRTLTVAIKKLEEKGGKYSREPLSVKQVSQKSSSSSNLSTPTPKPSQSNQAPNRLVNSFYRAAEGINSSSGIGGGRRRREETPRPKVNYIPEGGEHVREVGRRDLFGGGERK
jgi:hypothetical protein